MALFKLEIVTPSGRFFEQDVEAVNFYSTIGKIEILPGHISYMSELIPPAVEIKLDGIFKKAAVKEGVIYFQNNVCIVLTEGIEWA